MSSELDTWRSWVGRTEEHEDRIDRGRARALQKTLVDAEVPVENGEELPPLWHWIYFWTVAAKNDIGPEGHAARNTFLPPINLPRRMWGGSKFVFHRPLIIGADAWRISTIKDITEKSGTSGPLVFVTLSHEISDAEGLCLEEEMTIVYREAHKPGQHSKPGEPAPAVTPWRQKIEPNPVLLFRYSALTMNSHRIHYDWKYTTEVEGYAGLVVHGPLLATLMVELLRHKRPGNPLTHFSFRAERPVFDTAPFIVAGKPIVENQAAELWVADADGKLAMRGTAELALPLTLEPA